MAACTHLDQISVLSVPEDVPGCEDCLATGDRWVHLRDVPGVRTHRLLRLVAQPPCPRARGGGAASRLVLGGAGGGVVVLLRGRRLVGGQGRRAGESALTRFPIGAARRSRSSRAIRTRCSPACAVGAGQLAPVLDGWLVTRRGRRSRRCATRHLHRRRSAVLDGTGGRPEHAHARRHRARAAPRPVRAALPARRRT